MNRKTALLSHVRAPSRTPLALALVAALSFAPLAASAAIITVTSNADPGDSGTCTLRQAIVTMNHGANADTDEGHCRTGAGDFGSNDTIVFDTTAFPSDGSGTITLTSGRLGISNTDLSIDASANGNVTIDANHASGVMRDRAYAPASLLLKHLTLTNGNVTTADCHASFKEGGGLCIPYADLTLDHGTLIGNTAADNGGGILSISGSVTLIHSRLSGNVAMGTAGTNGMPGTNGTGGAMDCPSGSAVLIDSTLNGNSAIRGGGIYSHNGSVTLANSTLSGNSASYRGGGIYSGIGSVALGDSTLSGNTATAGAGLYTQYGSAALINSTLSGNSATQKGGAISSYYSGITLTNTTLSGNSAATAGGISDNYGQVTAINTIVAANTGGNIVQKNELMVLGDHNLIDTDPLLGALADNGGSTQTMLPQTGSPAIDAGACHVLGDGIPLTDQRDMIRPDPGSTSVTPCDIGAVELGSISNEIFTDGFE